MAEATPLSRTVDEFDRARGDDMDGVWAFSASWRLLMRDVDVTLVVDGLNEALDVVRETQESPQDLFGDARQHADTLYDRWVEEGRLVLDDGCTTWRDAVVTGLVLAALVAGIFAVLLLVRRELGTAAVASVAGISLALGLGAAVGQAASSRRHRRPAPGPGVPDDARWSMELTEILRSRHAMSGPRVRDIVAEAHAHAAQSGRSVQDEFGTPEQYAAHFAPDLARRSRWKVFAFAALALCAGILLADGFRWPAALMTATFAWWALSEHRNARRLRATAH